MSCQPGARSLWPCHKAGPVPLVLGTNGSAVTPDFCTNFCISQMVFFRHPLDRDAFALAQLPRGLGHLAGGQLPVT